MSDWPVQARLVESRSKPGYADPDRVHRRSRQAWAGVHREGHVHFGHSIEGRGVDYPATGRPETTGDFEQVVAPSTRDEIEGDERAEPDCVSIISLGQI